MSSDVVAIDFHPHAERAADGRDSLPPRLREAAARHFRCELPRPTAQEVADHYRERRMMAMLTHSSSRARTSAAIASTSLR